MFSFFVFHFFNSFSQNGNTSYQFLNFETSPRSVAMGGDLISIYDNDLLISQKVPSILSSEMNNDLSFSYVDYFADINVVSFSYAKNLKDIGCLSLGIISADYGEFFISLRNWRTKLNLFSK